MLGFLVSRRENHGDKKEVIINFEDKITAIVEILREKKAEGIRALDLRKIDSVITNGFVICSAESERQVSAISEHLRVSLKERGEAILHIEGSKLNQWVLMDTGDIVVHVFLDRVRDFYRLEQLWAHAVKVVVPDSAMPDSESN